MTDPNWRRLRDGRLDWALFRSRHAMVRFLRDDFDSRGYLETEAPLLVPCPTLDSNIQSLRVDVASIDGLRRRFYLHTSPEYAMKKLLAAGAERLYFLGKVFRDGETTALHNPEFTMLEWYRADASIRDLLDETEDFISRLAVQITGSTTVRVGGRTVDLSPPWPRVRMADLFRESTGADLDPGSGAAALRRVASRLGVFFNPEDDWETMFMRIYLERMEPGLGFDKPVFLTDYPAGLAMNARLRNDDTRWAERCELFIGGLELANGYTEITDPAEQRRRFESDRGKKRLETGSEPPVDLELLEAMEAGLPPCAGMALGVDRLVMLLLNRRDIADVLISPLPR
ncbi:EF-P lysine aminoacylase GenX [bacterium]|nr:EF-P lysine aminoacylase GenX [bacterium]